MINTFFNYNQRQISTLNNFNVNYITIFIKIIINYWLLINFNLTINIRNFSIATWGKDIRFENTPPLAIINFDV